MATTLTLLKTNDINNYVNMENLTISCTSLEEVRTNLDKYVSFILSGKKQIRRTGMLSQFNKAIEYTVNGTISIEEAKKRLQIQYSEYANNAKNRRRISYYLQAFDSFFKEYNKLQLAFIDGHRHIKFPITGSITLTGYTPILLHNEKGYFGYIVSEEPINWQSQLRFPIYQSYLATNTLNCDIKEMYVGIYCIKSGKFEFKSFTKREIDNVVLETTDVVINLQKKINPPKK